MKKQILILKQNNTKITVHKEYMEIRTPQKSYIVSFLHLEAIYLNKTIDINIGACYAISKKIPLFITDHNGYIIANLRSTKDEEV